MADDGERQSFWHDVQHSLALASVLAAAVDLEESLSDASRRRLGLLREEMRFLGEMARSAAPARPRAGRGGADLRVVLEDAVAVLGEVYPAEVRVEGEPVTVGVDACAARRLVANLLENALVAIGSGGRVVASLHRDGDAAVVEIADSGPGFGPAGAPTFGCGLATVTSLVTRAGGSLTFGTSAWGGAKVTVRLPVG